MDFIDYNHNTIYNCSPDDASSGFSKLMYLIITNTCNDYIIDYINCNPQEINYKNNNGWTALMLCVCNSQIRDGLPIIKILLQSGANIDDTNVAGWTALMIAARHTRTCSNINIVKLLCDNNANINLQDANGWTALMYACYFSNITSDFDTVKLLLDYGAHVNIYDTNNWTSLMYTVCNYKHKNADITHNIIQLLLNFGANVNFKSIHGNNALQLYFRYSKRNNVSLNIIELFLNNGINVNSKNNDGHTTLSVLCKKKYCNDIDVVKLLLNAGADINSRGNDNYTAIMYLFERNIQNKIPIIELLIQYGAFVNINDVTICLEHKYGDYNFEIIYLLLKYGVIVDAAVNVLLKYIIKHTRIYECLAMVYQIQTRKSNYRLVLKHIVLASNKLIYKSDSLFVYLKILQYTNTNFNIIIETDYGKWVCDYFAIYDDSSLIEKITDALKYMC